MSCCLFDDHIGTTGLSGQGVLIIAPQLESKSQSQAIKKSKECAYEEAPFQPRALVSALSSTQAMRYYHE